MDYSFGNWVKRRRKALDLTQSELAQQVGCSLATIVKIESDERRPSRQLTDLLAQKLQIPPEQQSIFLKTARQEKSADSLDSIPALSSIEPTRPLAQSTGNLPVSAMPLIGRKHEVSVIVRQLLEPSCRLLTLTGPGGVGKTRLGIEAGHQLSQHFADGVFFIPMAGVGMNESIIPVIADMLGLSFSGPAEPLVQISNFLRARNILLVIDNMEHLLPGGHVLAEILEQTQHIKMLVTSREQLHLQWEWIFEVQGLPIPEGTDINLENNSAFTLFVQRARQASRDFSPQAHDLRSIAHICRLVGGLPLAIELAASWVRLLSSQEIAQELERSLDFLETRYVDVPQRHRSIKTVFDHSWRLLTDDEKIVLKRLSVFQGGFTRKAAIAVAGASLATLSSLMDKSLLRYSKQVDRYDLHELIRQYISVQLQSDPDEEYDAWLKYSRFYSDWVASLESAFKSAQQPQTSQLLRDETANWLGSWRWAVEHEQIETLRRMTPCLNWYLEVHGFYAEALSMFKSTVDHFRSRGAPGQVKNDEERSAFAFFLDSLGWFEFRMGNVELGSTLLTESLQLANETRDTEVLYYIHGNWGYLALAKGEIEVAERMTAESLRYGQLLTPWHVAIPVSVLGIVAYQRGDLEESFRQLTESLKIWRTVGDPRGLVFCMLYLGMTALALEDFSTTRSVLQESNQIAAANMDRWAHAFGLEMLGMLALSQGENAEALAYFSQSLTLSREIGDQLTSTQTTIHVGRAHAALGSIEEARCLFKESYTSARTAKWIPVILSALISYLELPSDHSPEVRLAATLSILSHSAVTPNMRARCETIRHEMYSTCTAQQIETAAQLTRERNPEEWAQEIIL